jgi:hypothetical protein
VLYIAAAYAAATFLIIRLLSRAQRGSLKADPHE